MSRSLPGVLDTRIVVHPAGVIAIVAVLAAGALALAWGWPGALVFAMVIGVALLVAVATILRPVRFEVEVTTDQPRVVVGTVSVARVEVTAGTRGSPPAVIDVPVGSATASFLVPRLGPREQFSEPFLIPTTRRQVLELGPATAVRSDALGLLSRDTVLSGSERIYVHPRTVLPAYDATGLLHDVEGVRSSALSPADISFHALRDYAPGDDRRHVHWPSSAKAGKLVVRQFEQTRRSAHLVVIDLRRDAYGDEAAAELALGMGASYGVEAVLNDRDVMLRCGDEVMPSATPMRLLDAVTTREFVDAGESLPELVHSAVQAMPHASACTVITGTRLDDEEVLRATRALPLSATGLVLRATTDGRIVRKRLGGAVQFTCSSLEQLRRVSAAVLT